MFEFLRFGRTKQTKDEAEKSKLPIESVAAKSATLKKQLELVHLALNSVLRRHGIATQWIGCELAPMSRAGAADMMLTQLVIRKWHEGLMRYAPDLQNELVKEICLFDKSALASNFLFVWRFSPECGYVSGKLPEPDFWASTPPIGSEAAVPAAKSSSTMPATKTPKVKFDLPKSELGDDDDDDGSGFPATKMFTK